MINGAGEFARKSDVTGEQEENDVTVSDVAGMAIQGTRMFRMQQIMQWEIMQRRYVETYVRVAIKTWHEVNGRNSPPSGAIRRLRARFASGLSPPPLILSTTRRGLPTALSTIYSFFDEYVAYGMMMRLPQVQYFIKTRFLVLKSISCLVLILKRFIRNFVFLILIIP